MVQEQDELEAAKVRCGVSYVDAQITVDDRLKSESENWIVNGLYAMRFLMDSL